MQTFTELVVTCERVALKEQEAITPAVLERPERGQLLAKFVLKVEQTFDPFLRRASRDHKLRFRCFPAGKAADVRVGELRPPPDDNLPAGGRLGVNFRPTLN